MFPLTRLILKNLLRNRARSLLTGGGILIAVLAFGLLRTLVDAFYSGVDASSSNRLITRNAVSLAFSLPLSYQDNLRRLPGVTRIAYATFFGGVYINEQNFFPQFAIEPDSYLALYPEYRLTPEERNNFLRDRRGAVVGAKTANRFGWKVGDQIPLRGTFYPGTFSFTLHGIYHGADPGVDEGLFLFHYRYLNESMRSLNAVNVDQVGIFIIGIDDPIRAAEVSLAVDAGFRNSRAETLTETEGAFKMSFVAMAGAIVTLIQAMSYFMVLIVLAVMANTLAMTVRERRSEYATMKAMGFGPGRLVYLILGESMALSLVSGLAGAALVIPTAAWTARKLGTIFPSFAVSTETLLYCVLAAIFVGTMAAIWPAWYVVRVPVTAALRSVT